MFAAFLFSSIIPEPAQLCTKNRIFSEFLTDETEKEQDIMPVLYPAPSGFCGPGLFPERLPDPSVLRSGRHFELWTALVGRRSLRKNFCLNGSGVRETRNQIFKVNIIWGYNYKVGFRSCESLGAEINKNLYIRGKVSLGGILRLGPWQMTISVQNRVLSIASEIDLQELNDLCYDVDKNRLLSIFHCRKWSTD